MHLAKLSSLLPPVPPSLFHLYGFELSRRSEGIEMCRWIVYFSHEEPILLADLLIRPGHSLLKQVDEHYLPGLGIEAPPSEANDRRSPNNFTNLDGFGIGWYSRTPATHRIYSTPDCSVAHPDTLPTVYKLTTPPLHDENLDSLAHSIESKVVFGHIRASTTGMVQLANCHPFRWGRFLFQHNGSIGRFADIQLELMNLVGPHARSKVRGTTDTEWFAALFFYHLDSSERATWLDDFSLDDQVRALSHTIATVIRLVELKGGYVLSQVSGDLSAWFSSNVAITDGERLIALRYVYPGSLREAPSLYWSTTVGATFDRKYRSPHPDGEPRDVGDRPSDQHRGHVVVASEPMTRDEREWHLMRPGQALVVDERGRARFERIARNTDPSLSVTGDRVGTSSDSE